MTVKRRSPGGLIALNIVLLAILALVTLSPQVSATENSGAMAGDYVIIGGSITGSPGNAIYLLEQRSGALIGFRYDQSGKRLILMGARSVARDSERARPPR